MRPIHNSIFAVLICSYSAVAWGGQPLILPPGTFKPAEILPAPPADDSIEARAERAYIKAAYNNASPAERAAAINDAANESVRAFADTVPGFDLDKLPATRALFKTVRTNEREQTGIFKKHFHRQRPYQVDNSIIPCQPPKNFDINASDPSGHTTMAFSSAVILSNLLPDYAPAIMRRAEQFGRYRIVCGAHHPFDVRSGQVLGTLIGVTLLKSPELQPQLNAARAELAQQIPTPSATLLETEWVATDINGYSIKGTPPSLTIEQDHAFGSSGCNRYTSKVSRDGMNGIVFGPVAGTRMACLNDTDQQEYAYYKALESVTGYHLNQNELILLDKDFNKIVEFNSKSKFQPR